MIRKLSIALAQLNWRVGDIEGNAQRMLQTMEQQPEHVDLVIFSELSLTGYPPEDLLLRAELYPRCLIQLKRLAAASHQHAILVGHPWYSEGKLFNALSLFWQGQLLVRYYKQRLPNYGVFDELRYFSPGRDVGVVDFKGYRLGLLICEDLWFDEPVNALKVAGAELVLSVHASPYDKRKMRQRHQLIARHCRRTHLPIVYLNQVGGQDELIFDGHSSVFNSNGQQTACLAGFSEQIALLTVDDQPKVTCMSQLAQMLSPLAQLYQALVLGVRDYVTKSGFQGVILGLSGGIDSALTLAIAVDALGKDQVQAVMMPFYYTATISQEDAQQQAHRLEVSFDTFPIDPLFEAFRAQLAPLLTGTHADITLQNLQARCRGTLLMALANKQGRLVLNTGNKSEMAVGYTTLYGDMVGAFAVLKDVSKTLVYQLARYRNRCSPVIPQRVFERLPSAELAPGQHDQQTLPPYAILDAILKHYVEQDQSEADLIAAGFDPATLRRVIRLIDRNEYKRRQAAIGPRITQRNFGKDRRYPIISGFVQ